MDEATLVRRILTKLKSEYPHGIWYKIHTGPFQERGVPDIVGCLRGRFIAFEVKTPQAKRGVTNYQQIQLDRINSAEGRATVVRSVKEVMAFLSKHFKTLRPGDRPIEVKKSEEIPEPEEMEEPEAEEPKVEEPAATDDEEQEVTVSDKTDEETEEPPKKSKKSKSSKKSEKKKGSKKSKKKSKSSKK